MAFAILALAALTTHPAVCSGILTSVPGPELATTEGFSQIFTLGTILDSDNTETLSSLTALVSWGDGSAQTAASLSGGNGEFLVMGSHTYAQAGVYAPEVSASNGPSQTQFVDSASVADAPLQAGALSPILSQEGSSFSGMVANFTDQNTEALASAFTAAINWGDGTASEGIIVADGNGAFAVNGSHTYEEDGVYTPVVTIQDSGGSELVEDGLAQVTDAPLVPQSFQPSVITIGDPVNGVLANFLDDNPFGLVSQFSTTITWGDGSAPSIGAIATEGDGEFSVSGQHIYAETGQFPVTVSVFDEGGSTITLLGTETVDPSPEPGSFLIAGAGLAIVSIVTRRPL
jgi:large repetitive protein